MLIIQYLAITKYIMQMPIMLIYKVVSQKPNKMPPYINKAKTKMNAQLYIRIKTL